MAEEAKVAKHPGYVVICSIGPSTVMREIISAYKYRFFQLVKHVYTWRQLIHWVRHEYYLRCHYVRYINYDTNKLVYIGSKFVVGSWITSHALTVPSSISRASNYYMNKNLISLYDFYSILPPHYKNYRIPASNARVILMLRLTVSPAEIPQPPMK